MNLLGQPILGVLILLLLAFLIIVKGTATGTIIDVPKGNIRVRLADSFNLFCLLIVNPLAAILLLIRQMDVVDPSHVALNGMALVGVEIFGLVLYVMGFFLMAWALLTLKRHFQAGGSSPRAMDEMILSGPYRFIRHPMYAAALSIALGLAGMVQSLACLIVFFIYVVLIVLLIPVEEQGLEQAYREQYRDYQQHTQRLVPFVY